MPSGFEYVFNSLLERMHHVPYHRTDLLLDVEREIYASLEQVPDDVSGLIVLLKNQQMQGKNEKARALAHKIWNIGGQISPYLEYVFVQTLLSLGMLDMALTLLQPRFGDLHGNIEMFAPAFIRFALLTGNIPLLEKVAAACPDGRGVQFSEFIEAYRELDYIEHFKNIQRLVAETLKDHRLGFEYKLYYDRGFTDLSAVYYTDVPPAQCASAASDLNRKIDACHTSSGIQRIYNYEVLIKNISEHPEDFMPLSVLEPETSTDSAKDWGL